MSKELLGIEPLNCSQGNWFNGCWVA